MSAVPSSPGAGDTLWLTGLQHGGIAWDFQWQWPAGARTQWLDDVLREVVPTGPAQRDGLAAFSLLRSGPDEQPGWWLTNHGSAMACAVDGQVVPRGSQQRLNAGDEIEIGLMRLLVTQGPRSPGHEGPDHGGGAAPPFDPAAVGFELAMLDVCPAPGGRAHFEDLIPLAAAAPLEEDVPCGSRTPADADPLAALHAQYLAKLRNPLHVDAGGVWQDLVLGHQPSVADPVLQWMRVAGQQPSVDDLLGQSCRIESVMAHLDALCFSDVFSPEPFDNVIELFAPDGWRTQGQDALGQGLPSLTRREHHSLSPDSAVSLFNLPTTTSDNPEPNSP